MSKVYEQKVAAGDLDAIAFIQGMSPVAWQHVNMFGSFEFSDDEQGIDLRAQSSNALEEYLAEHFGTVIVLCGCLPELPQDWKQRPLVEDWDIADPVAGDLDSHRRARDLISTRIDSLLQQLAKD